MLIDLILDQQFELRDAHARERVPRPGRRAARRRDASSIGQEETINGSMPSMNRLRGYPVGRPAKQGPIARRLFKKKFYRAGLSALDCGMES